MADCVAGDEDGGQTSFAGRRIWSAFVARDRADPDCRCCDGDFAVIAGVADRAAFSDCSGDDGECGACAACFRDCSCGDYARHVAGSRILKDAGSKEE